MDAVKRLISKQFPKVRSLGFLTPHISNNRLQLQPSRQKLSLKSDTANKALDDLATLSSIGITSDGELVVKDLGAQISWRTVFLTEYVRFLTHFLRGLVKLLVPGWTFDYTSVILSLPCSLLWQGLQA